jgi:hypothetical protein
MSSWIHVDNHYHCILATLFLVATRPRRGWYARTVYDTLYTLPPRHRFKSLLPTRELVGMCDELLDAHLFRVQQLNRHLVIPRPVPEAPFEYAFFCTYLSDGEDDVRCTKAGLDEHSSTPQRMQPTADTQCSPRSVYHNVGAIIQLKGAHDARGVISRRLVFHQVRSACRITTSKGQPRRLNVDCQNCQGTEGPGNCAAQQANRPSSKNDDILSYCDARQLDRMHRYAQRLHQCTFFDRGVRWQTEAKVLWERVISRQRPVVWGCRRKLHERAEIVSPAATIVACLARYARLQGYAVATLDSRDLRADIYYLAGGLVAEHERLPHHELADLAVLPVVDLVMGEGKSAEKVHARLGGEGALVRTSDPQSPVASTRIKTCLSEGNFGTGRSS